MNEVKVFENGYLGSNTYLIKSGINSVIIVDAGFINESRIVQWLKKKYISIDAVILTHEHADHCCGVIPLYHYQPFPLYCSKSTAKGIKSSRLNLSAYLEEIDNFEINIPVCEVMDNDCIRIGNKKLQFIYTPGHSPGSTCIFIENKLFSGDTILPENTPLNLPGSNKAQYKESIRKLENNINSEMKIYPGHGKFGKSLKFKLL